MEYANLIMESSITETQLFALADKIETLMGLHFPQAKHTDLTRKLHYVAEDLGCSNTATCVEKLITEPLNQRYQNALAKHLTIGETYFFRNKTGIALLKSKIFPDMIRKREAEKRLKIWSAACSTGEEPYSFAMLLDSLQLPNNAWQYKIFASDISLDFLEKANRGIYSNWSFRNTTQFQKNRYFLKPADNKYQIVDRIKQRVDFFQWNLVSDIYPSILKGLHNLDFISCQNVFIYFEPETIFKILKRFYETLDDGGWLLVSPSEAPFISASEFHYTGEALGGIFFQKRSRLSSVAMAYNAEMQYSPKTITSCVPQTELEPSPPLPSVGEDLTEDALYELALQNYQHGHYDALIDQLKTAMFGGDEFRYCGDKSFKLLIQVYVNTQQYTAALQCCESVIAENKLNVLPHYLMGTVLQLQGQYNAAVESFRRALFLDDSCMLAYFALANSFRKLSKNRQAIQTLKNLLKSLDRHPENEILKGDDELTVKTLKITTKMLLADLEE